MRTADPAVSRRPLVIATVASVVPTLVLLPFGAHQLAQSASFLPVMLAIVACFDVLSVYLLVGDYRDRGDVRLLMMAWAYTWSLVVMTGYALAFPGALAQDPPLALTRSMAPYLYVAWHTGFPVLLGLAWAPWPVRWTLPTPASRRRVLSLASIGVVGLAGTAVVLSLAAAADRLPVLIQGLDTARMTTLTAPVALPLVCVALWVTARGTAGRSGPERWSLIAVAACLCDLALTYAAKSRYSLGWYAGRSLTLVSAGVVLLAMLAAFRRVKAQAEHDATFDALTGLHNRRSTHAQLEQLVARSHRYGVQLSLVSLDLDLFKLVNDHYGHEAGDDVLAELGRQLRLSSRVTDVVARVGGEEFLVLLPDTDAAGAAVVAEKVRLAVAAMVVPAIDGRVTASFGTAALRGGETVADVLRRVDAALYRAKRLGGNTVVGAPEPRTGAGRPVAATDPPGHAAGVTMGLPSGA